MSRRKAKRNRNPANAAPVKRRQAGISWWWPITCFVVGIGAALVARKLLEPTGQPARPVAEQSAVGPPNGGSPTGAGPASQAPAGLSSANGRSISEAPDASDLELDTLSARELEFAECLRQGYAHFQSQRYSEAIERLEAASEIDPTVPDPYHFLGEIYQKLEYWQQAEQFYRQALSVKPTYTLSRKSLAVVLYETGRYEEATAVLRALREDRPEDTFVLGELAINALALGEPGQAIELLRQYNRAEGKQAWGYAHLGRAYADSGDAQRAEQAYREALAVDSKFALAQYWLGQLLASLGETDESERLLTQYREMRRLQTRSHQLDMALMRNSKDVKVLFELARVRYQLGDLRQSLILLGRARRLRPNDPQLARLYRQVAASFKKREAAGNR
jgi:Flp pilus assembly protein TadD